MALTITVNAGVPDSTYFALGNVEPDISSETGRLDVLSGRGTRRGWGAPEVTSTVVLNDDDLCAVHVGFHHKHRGGQGWFYYRSGAAGWDRVTWPRLSDAERTRVLAAEHKAPGWAKSPGTLRTQRARPSTVVQTAYKLVAQDEAGRMTSVYDESVEYRLGTLLAEKAGADHEGGFYTYRSLATLRAQHAERAVFPDEAYTRPLRLALLECQISGRVIDYGHKQASTYLRPVRVVEILEVGAGAGA